MDSMIVEVAITDISHSKNMIVPGLRKHYAWRQYTELTAVRYCPQSKLH